MKTFLFNFYIRLNQTKIMDIFSILFKIKQLRIYLPFEYMTFYQCLGRFRMRFRIQNGHIGTRK